MKLNAGWDFDVEAHVKTRMPAGVCRAMAKVCFIDNCYPTLHVSTHLISTFIYRVSHTAH